VFESLKIDIFQKWPNIDKKMLEKDSVEFVVQINGKKRGNIKTQKDIDEKTLMEQIKKDSKISKNFNNKKINKIFFVKNRLINILIT